jgi:hypothetical protein
MRNKIIIQIIKYTKKDKTAHKKIFSLLSEIGRKEINECECASLLNFAAAIICRMLPARGRPFATFLDGLGQAQKKVKHTSSASPFWLFSTFPLLEESQQHPPLPTTRSIQFFLFAAATAPLDSHHSRDLDLVSKSRDERRCAFGRIHT